MFYMGLQKSNFVLGTVQLGMKYGLNNRHSQPTPDESFSILDAAFAAGINTFDTAYAYGTAEDILGAWIKDRSLADKIRIISKMKPHVLNDYPDGAKAVDIIKIELEKTLNRLNLKSIDGYLFHSPHYIYLRHMVDGMKKIRDIGVVKNIGVSIYNEAEALQAVEMGIDYVQVPYNIFDQRLDRTVFFELAKKNKVTVFARSPFLQGLLLTRPERIPKNLFYMRPYVEQFIEIVKKYHLSPVEASLIFVKAHCRADYIVFGIDTLSQLKNNIDIINNFLPNTVKGLVEEIENCFKDFNQGAVNPSLWSKIKL